MLPIRIANDEDLEAVFAVDDDAFTLYATEGLVIDLPATHPFAVGERARWAASVRRGDTLLALGQDGEPVGFAAMGVVDGSAYLDQLSVRRAAMRRGVGTALIEAAREWARARFDDGLWLDTYGHLSWNRPFYERRGFRVVPESDWRPGMRAIVEQQRSCLPRPDQRVVMHRA